MTARQARKVLRLPIPGIYAHSSNSENPVGAEYTIEEKAEGVPLARLWYKWTQESKLAFLPELVDFEAQLQSFCFKHHGCIYYRKDLEGKNISLQPLQHRELLSNGPGTVLSLSDEFAVGPLTREDLWRNERAVMHLERGPCKLSQRTLIQC